MLERSKLKEGITELPPADVVTPRERAASPVNEYSNRSLKSVLSSLGTSTLEASVKGPVSSSS